MKNSRTGAEIQAAYQIGESFTLVGGAIYEEQKVYDSEMYQNYVRHYKGKSIYSPLPSMQLVKNIPGHWLSNKDHHENTRRGITSPFLEGLWDITSDLRLTVGGRYDYYSGGKDEFSHCGGLTWEFIDGYNARLFYGSSFRAPTLYEITYFDTGNPDLDFVEYTTWMMGLDAQFTPSLSGRANFTAYDMTDSIRVDQKIGKFVNIDDRFRTTAIEAELKYDFGRGTFLSLCYSHANPSNETLYEIPAHSGTLMANIRLSKYLNLNADLYYAHDFTRRDYESDRDKPSDYGIVNATLIARKFWERFAGLELRGSVYNLFDKDYVYPRPRQYWQNLDDLPAPGRSFLVEAKYTF
jgi:outer membrane receptor protein involved in Fe transport